MDAELQAFKDALAEKAAAKYGKVMPAVAAGDWDTVAKEGINGTEGKAMAKAQKLADEYVKNHPDAVSYLLPYTDAAYRTTIIRDGVAVEITGQEAVVAMVTLASKAGMEETALAITMFELAYFDRQQIGVGVQVKTRNPLTAGG